MSGDKDFKRLTVRSTGKNFACITIHTEIHKIKVRKTWRRLEKAGCTKGGPWMIKELGVEFLYLQTLV